MRIPRFSLDENRGLFDRLTVRGTGTLRLKPDWTELSMTLKSLDKDYARSAEKAAEQLDALQRALEDADFSAEALKTTGYRIDTEHESQQDENGHYRSVFIGYACVHELKLAFAFDTVKLARAIDAVTRCVADPGLDVRFTVRDKDAASDELLAAAAANARAKAETLAKAAGVTLGELLRIDYNCGEPELYSPTGFGMAKRGAVRATVMELTMAPEDVEASDSADFVWAIR